MLDVVQLLAELKLSRRCVGGKNLSSHASFGVFTQMYLVLIQLRIESPHVLIGSVRNSTKTEKDLVLKEVLVLREVKNSREKERVSERERERE